MRPTEFTLEQIIAAGTELSVAGRNVTGFALRKLVGGGNPARMKQAWDEYVASQSTTDAAEPVAELPVEVAEQLETAAKALTERLSAFAVELNDRAVKSAERRVADVLRSAGEQREEMERELADASQTLDDLEEQLEKTKGESAALEQDLHESTAQGQSQAVELAQLHERLSATEKATQTAAEAHTKAMQAAEDTHARAAEQADREIDGLRSDLNNAQTQVNEQKAELIQLRERLAAAERAAQAEAEAHAKAMQAAEKNHAAQLSKEQQSREATEGELVALSERLEQVRADVLNAKELAARFSGQLDSLKEQNASLLELVKTAPSSVIEE